MLKYLLFIALFSFAVAGDTVTEGLIAGESVEFLDKNITLVSTGEDKIVICINNERRIVDNERTVNDVHVDVRKIEDNFAEIKLRYTCNENCSCDADCANDRCISSVVEIENDSTNILEDECVTSSDCNDLDSCTVDRCVFGNCAYENDPSCITDEFIDEDGSLFPIIAISLVGVLLILIIIYIIRK